MSGAKEPSEYQADPLFTDLPQPSRHEPGYYAEPLFELPRQAYPSPTAAAPVQFYDLPEPSQTATALSATAGSLQLTPRQVLAQYSPEQWEEFILEWVLGLKRENYVSVVGLGGSHDRGADVAAFLTRHKTDGAWHCYQCKHYKTALQPAMAYPEMFKIIWAVEEGHYRVLPDRYSFVAPMIGRTLKYLLVKPEKLREEFLLWVGKNTAKLAGDYGKAAFQRTVDLARRTDFSCFEAPDLAQILEQHAKTRYHATRFATPLPPRVLARPMPPPRPEAHETRYVQKLYDVYDEKFEGTPTKPAQEHPTAKDNLQRQREHFYCAEQLRMFARDSVPPEIFPTLQEAVYKAVKEVEEDDFETGWNRLKAVMAAAQAMQLDGNPLIEVIDTRDRMGMCHQLANHEDDKLTWVRKDV
ncbi:MULTISPECIES: ABC-three component system protein [unclassified Streptomyces]|uniref:ABC-three component system protein n=1 Tax=unclassified Streptomyces TaxID=2593676 RepID=UPI00081E701D|nr:MULTISPECIES: ABC-three component system protein [unclassified Streptomyces]SCD31932.1 hypothetical protein GA0115243_100875 [Streptomyces sp. ScaeMP-e83]